MLLDNLYELISKDELEVSVRLSDSNHPIFKAHFPSQPILPGFIHLEIISDVFGMEIVEIKKAKFIEIVLPNQILVYKRNDNKIVVTCNKIIIANFYVKTNKDRGL